MNFLRVPTVVAISIAFVVPTVHAAIGKPNVIVIYTDDQGSVDANCYGSKDLITPNIDRLAATGVRFTQMLAPSAICSASRAGLLTGRIPARAGVPDNVSSHKGVAGMPHDEVTIAEMLGSNGYATGHVGKWHLGYTPQTMPGGQGFQSTFGHMGGCIDNYSHFFYWNGPNRHDLWENGREIWRDGEYFGDLMVDEVVRFIDSNQTGDAASGTGGSRPFFLYWAINWPHYPLQGTAKWREKYKDLPHPRSKYATFVSTCDEMIGRVLDHLESKGLRENTLVVFQSDHGHSIEQRTFGGGGSAGPYRGHKACLFEGGLRVPSIVSMPGHIPRGEVRDQFVTGCDWLPTIAEITGSKLPDNRSLDGKSILNVINNADAPSPHERFYWQLGRNPQKAQWVVREGDWKLYGNARESVTPEGTNPLTPDDRKLFLANLRNDIGETSNLTQKEPATVARLIEIARKYQSGIVTR